MRGYCVEGREMFSLSAIHFVIIEIVSHLDKCFRHKVLINRPFTNTKMLVFSQILPIL